jgi:anaphase-promoting complex subunit 8
MLLSVPLTKRKTSQSSPHTSAFSTSTPSRARSPRLSLSFTEQSPVPTQQVSQNASIPITSVRHPHAPRLQSQPEDIRAMELDLEWRDEDTLTTARTCVEAREFLRAVHLLRDCSSPKARFLSIYSQFIVSQVICFASHLSNRKQKASEKKALRDWHKLDSGNFVLIFSNSPYSTLIR